MSCLGDPSNEANMAMANMAIANTLTKPCMVMEDRHIQDTSCTISKNNETNHDLFPL